jgi:hypothetical protein
MFMYAAVISKFICTKINKHSSTNLAIDYALGINESKDVLIILHCA